ASPRFLAFALSRHPDPLPQHAPRVILVHVPLPREGAMRADFALASLSLLFLTGAVVPPKPPSLEGSYRLASRDLPGGSRQVPPGRSTSSRTRRGTATSTSTGKMPAGNCSRSRL